MTDDEFDEFRDDIPTESDAVSGAIEEAMAEVLRSDAATRKAFVNMLAYINELHHKLGYPPLDIPELNS